MIKPAICYKEQLENALKPYFYTNDMLYYVGTVDNLLLEIDSTVNGRFQYAVLNSEEKLIGYIAYMIDAYSSNVYGFGAFSFDRGNIIFGRELLQIIETLIGKWHRVEFRAVEGNPAVKNYDHLCKKYNGTKHIFKDVFKDMDGEYHDTYLYEFVNGKR